MVTPLSPLGQNEKKALLHMFGPIWQKKFSTLDGQKGRPNLIDCVDFALRKLNAQAKEDLVDYVETYLKNMARRCKKAPQN